MKIHRVVHFIDESGGAWPWQRQLQNDQSIWGGTKYYFDMKDHPDADWLVVFSAWPQIDFVTSVPKERRIFIAGEPESFHIYQAKFLDQFGTVLTTQCKTRHQNAIHSQVGINWFAGVRFVKEPQRFQAALDFADFEEGNPTKTKLCSVVCSNQTVTRGHRERLAFVEHLKQAFGDQIDYFGRGSRPMPDKDEALAEYTFHISLENSQHQDYWTEKLADPFLRGCFPIYSGCTNIHEYFPKDSLVLIDTSKPSESIEIIRKTLQLQLSQENYKALAMAKHRILFQYNVFAVLENLFDTKLLFGGPENICCQSEQIFSDHMVKNQKMTRKLKRYLRSLFSSQ